MTDFTIDDLRLPCEHGRLEHHPIGGFHSSNCCNGGRVPTQAEINALTVPNYEASLIEYIRQQKLGHVNWHEVVDAALGGGE